MIAIYFSSSWWEEIFDKDTRLFRKWYEKRYKFVKPSSITWFGLEFFTNFSRRFETKFSFSLIGLHLYIWIRPEMFMKVLTDNPRIYYKQIYFELR